MSGPDLTYHRYAFHTSSTNLQYLHCSSTPLHIPPSIPHNPAKTSQPTISDSTTPIHPSTHPLVKRTQGLTRYNPATLTTCTHPAPKTRVASSNQSQQSALSPPCSWQKRITIHMLPPRLAHIIKRTTRSRETRSLRKKYPTTQHVQQDLKRAT